MLGDLVDIIRAAGARDGEPCLVEVGRALHEHTTTTAFVWSTGRITAAVGPGSAQLERRRGGVGDAVRLDLAELRALSVACQDWAGRRCAWAAFYASSAGYPPPYGHAWYYRARGASSRPVRVGDVVMGQRRGEELCGHDEIVPLQKTIELTDGAQIEAEVWRRGERQGPADGSLTGLRYRLGDALALDAERQGAKVVRGRAFVHLEPGEEAFIAAILGVVGHDDGPSGRSR